MLFVINEFVKKSSIIIISLSRTLNAFYVGMCKLMFFITVRTDQHTAYTDLSGFT